MQGVGAPTEGGLCVLERFRAWMKAIRMVPVPDLYLVSGLFALVGAMLAMESPARIAAAVASVPMIAMWSLLRNQDRQLGELREQLNNSKEEVITRRSTMRFIFDELLHEPDKLPPQVTQNQQQMERALVAASGFAELLGQTLECQPPSVGQIYLRELTTTLERCTALNRQLVRRGPGLTLVKRGIRGKDPYVAGRHEEPLAG